MKLLDNKITFPHPDTAHESGILAIGGDLSFERLLLAYAYGAFPWFNEGEPIVWWHPDPRFVLFPSEIKVAKSIRSYFNQEKYKVTIDKAFYKMITMCGHSRRLQSEDTWISRDIIKAYGHMHDQGLAHSIEVWEGEDLVGGLYGVALGKIFYGESMFSAKKNASKVGLISLAYLLQRHDFRLIDCQIGNPHLESMGGRYIQRKTFLQYLRSNNLLEANDPTWKVIKGEVDIKDIPHKLRNGILQ